jgi:hypothetical protein
VELKAGIQLIGESQQEFATAVEQLPHRAVFRSSVNFMQRVAAYTFVDEGRDG